MIGEIFGPYQVVAKLGAGGMGEVYRARDTKLGRDVAIKVVLESLLADEDRAARFEREARSLAALNHPNIAQIYGFEAAGSSHVLVMELVEGRDLSEVIASGQPEAESVVSRLRDSDSAARRGGGAPRGLNIDEALPIARQIAEALEAAHDSGIVHRDLKPANIKVRPDGTVKVLDFGLAKVIQGDGSNLGDQGSMGATNLANSPTMTTPAATAMGMILGTAAYMSPEQARGRPVDKRADIWAFGVVLYEMLSGHAAFAGDTVTDIIAAVITREPDWTALPDTTPPAVLQLVRRCLERDPKRRLRDIGEAGLVLADAIADPHAATQAAEPQSMPAPNDGATWRGFKALSAVLGVALVASLGMLWQSTRTVEPAPLRLDVLLPPGAALRTENRPVLAISRDGSTVAFTAVADGVSRLYVRRRDEAEARVLAGTDGASDPAFSPDGRWIAFAAMGELKKVSLDGPVIALAPLTDSRSATWVNQSTIVFGPGPDTPLLAIDAGGGATRAVTELDQAQGERTHRWPTALPGGEAVLFTVGSRTSPDDYDAASIDAVLLASGERRHILQGASFVRYSPTGHLLFARGGAVYAVPFDAERLAATGEPVPVVQDVAGDATTGASHFAVSDDGTLVYVAGAGTNRDRQLFWVTASGPPQPLGNLGAAFYNDPAISPDGRQAAFVIGSSGGGDVWVYDIDRSTPTRLTFDGINGSPAWSRDSRFVYYSAIDADGTVFRRKRADGGTEPEDVGSYGRRAFLDQVDSPEGSLVATAYQGSQDDILGFGPDTADDVTPLVSTGANEGNASVSPDGRWMAYYTDSAGREEVFVRDLQPGGGRWQISTAGGTEPRWSADGRELFFRNDTMLMSVPVLSIAPFSHGQPRVTVSNIFNLRSDSMKSYDVDSKGGRFLMIRPADARATEAITGFRIVLNWFTDLREKLR